MSWINKAISYTKNLTNFIPKAFKVIDSGVNYIKTAHNFIGNAAKKIDSYTSMIPGLSASIKTFTAPILVPGKIIYDEVGNLLKTYDNIKGIGSRLNNVINDIKTNEKTTTKSDNNNIKTVNDLKYIIANNNTNDNAKVEKTDKEMDDMKNIINEAFSNYTK